MSNLKIPDDNDPRRVSRVDVGISDRAIQLGRSIDRLPAGRYVVIIDIRENKVWNTQIVHEKMLKQINSLME